MPRQVDPSPRAQKKREAAAAWKRENPDKVLAYKLANREKYREHSRNYRRRNPTTRESRYERHLSSAYNLTKDDYMSLLEKQGHVCAICKRPETTVMNGQVVQLSVDHCHATDVIRGLLCYRCNTGLGYFGDRADLLASAIDYLAGA